MQGFNLHLPIQQNTLITIAPSAAPLDLHNFAVPLAFQPGRMRFSTCFGAEVSGVIQALLGLILNCGSDQYSCLSTWQGISFIIKCLRIFIFLVI